MELCIRRSTLNNRSNPFGIIRKSSLILFLFCCPFFFHDPLAIAQNETTMENPIKQVILISIDGLHPDSIKALAAEKAPNLHYVIQNGATTLNARTDPDSTITLPNHTSMLTGRGVRGKQGHNYVENSANKRTLHEIKGEYVSSVFNVVHDQGLHTALFAAKDKFELYAKSYGARGVARGKSYIYKGRQFIDVYRIHSGNDYALVDVFLEELTKNPPNFAFLHLAGPDNVGHDFYWDISADSIYLKEVQRIDALVGQILKAIQNNRQLANSTVVIITADHGGYDDTHINIHDPRAYIIPFMVWGKGVAKGVELYAINPARKDPGVNQVPYSAEGQPIRNGDAGNLILSLLDLPAIPGSTINKHQDLIVLPQSK